MKSRLRRSRTLLILLGLSLGYLARSIFGPPISETENRIRFLKPLPDVNNVDLLDQDLDLKIRPGDDAYRGKSQGLVPPIKIEGEAPFLSAGLFNSKRDSVSFAAMTDAGFTSFVERDFEHDSQAAFEPHGNQVCASGCALSRHPTGKLTSKRFSEMMGRFAHEQVGAASPSLEELLFYGLQTRELIVANGFGSINTKQAEFLWAELKRTHAKISLRVIDSNGEIRTWLPPTRVPLDRRHVFEMETKNLQPLVTSGTVKRVGLDHLWIRL